VSRIHEPFAIPTGPALRASLKNTCGRDLSSASYGKYERADEWLANHRLHRPRYRRNSFAPHDLIAGKDWIFVPINIPTARFWRRRRRLARGWSRRRAP